MADQARADARLELPKEAFQRENVGVEDLFDFLDSSWYEYKGYIDEMDLMRFLKDFGSTAQLSDCIALIHEVQLRNPRSLLTRPGRLTLREAALLFLPVTSRYFKVIQDAESDKEARNVSYLLRHSEPYPKRGHLSSAVQYHLFRIIENAAFAAMNLEATRSNLTWKHGCDIAVQSDIFDYLAEGKACLTKADLRKAFFDQGLIVSEDEQAMLWCRYAMDGAYDISFPDFVRQLKPRT
jgi:hypothetical protein